MLEDILLLILCIMGLILCVLFVLSLCYVASKADELQEKMIMEYIQGLKDKGIDIEELKKTNENIETQELCTRINK